MNVLISVLIIIVSILLILIVLVQNSKGGGLASNFSSSNQIMGVRKTTDFLEKATWTLAVALLVFSILSSITIPREIDDNRQSIIQEQVNNASNFNSQPTVPTKNQVKTQIENDKKETKTE